MLHETGAANERRIRHLEKDLEVRLEDEGAGRAAGAGLEQEEGDEARHAVVVAELRRGALSVVRLRTEKGVLLTKTVSFVALLSLLDRSLIVDALDNESERRSALLDRSLRALFLPTSSSARARSSSPGTWSPLPAPSSCDRGARPR